MRKVCVLITWILIFSIDLGLTLYLLHKSTGIKFLPVLSKESKIREESFYSIYASLPQTIEPSQTMIISTDARIDLVRQYLESYKSPLTPYAKTIVTISDIYTTGKINDLWRYIIAIAQCESNLGIKIPESSHNAWGLGIPSGAKTGLSYSSWSEGINSVAKFLRKLIDRGLITPEEWGPIYAPPSVQNGGSWAKCVRHFLDDLQ